MFFERVGKNATACRQKNKRSWIPVALVKRSICLSLQQVPWPQPQRQTLLHFLQTGAWIYRYESVASCRLQVTVLPQLLAPTWGLNTPGVDSAIYWVLSARVRQFYLTYSNQSNWRLRLSFELMSLYVCHLPFLLVRGLWERKAFVGYRTWISYLLTESPKAKVCDVFTQTQAHPGMPGGHKELVTHHRARSFNKH